jgi:hypothetical protein
MSGDEKTYKVYHAIHNDIYIIKHFYRHILYNLCYIEYNKDCKNNQTDKTN